MLGIAPGHGAPQAGLEHGAWALEVGAFHPDDQGGDRRVGRESRSWPAGRGSADITAWPLTRSVVPAFGIRNSRATRGVEHDVPADCPSDRPSRRSGTIRVSSSTILTKPGPSPRGELSSPVRPRGRQHDERRGFDEGAVVRRQPIDRLDDGGWKPPPGKRLRGRLSNRSRTSGSASEGLTQTGNVATVPGTRQRRNAAGRDR